MLAGSDELLLLLQVDFVDDRCKSLVLSLELSYCMRVDRAALLGVLEMRQDLLRQRCERGGQP